MPVCNVPREVLEDPLAAWPYARAYAVRHAFALALGADRACDRVLIVVRQFRARAVGCGVTPDGMGFRHVARNRARDRAIKETAMKRSGLFFRRCI